MNRRCQRTGRCGGLCRVWPGGRLLVGRMRDRWFSPCRGCQRANIPFLVISSEVDADESAISPVYTAAFHFHTIVSAFADSNVVSPTGGTSSPVFGRRCRLELNSLTWSGRRVRQPTDRWLESARLLKTVFHGGYYAWL